MTNVQQYYSKLLPTPQAKHMAKKQVLPKILNIIILIFIILTTFGSLYGERIDLYYMIPSGEWMIEHGCAETFNVTAPIHMPIINQNWLLCIIVALLNNLGKITNTGFIPIFILHIIKNICIIVATYKLSSKLTGNAKLIPLFTTILLLCNYLAFTGYRITTFGMFVAFTCLIIPELYMQDKISATAFIPLLILTTLHANMQSALFIADIFCIIFILFTNLKQKDKRKMLGLTILAMLVFAIISNPYQLDAFTYAYTTSQTVNPYKLLNVIELKPIWEIYQKVIYILPNYIVLVIAFLTQTYIYLKSLKTKHFTWNKNPQPYLILSLLSIIATTFTIRLIAYATVFTIFCILMNAQDLHEYLRRVYHTDNTDCIVYNLLKTNIGKLYLINFIPIFTIIYLAVCLNILAINQVRTQQLTFTKEYLIFKNESLLNALPENKNIFTTTNYSSYITYKHNKVPITSRWEAWNQEFKDRNWIVDYHDTLITQKGFIGLMNNVRWDYSLVTDTDPIKDYFLIDPAWTLINHDNNWWLFQHVTQP